MNQPYDRFAPESPEDRLCHGRTAQQAARLTQREPRAKDADFFERQRKAQVAEWNREASGQSTPLNPNR